MNEDEQLKRKNQDESWEEGYFAGRDGEERLPPDKVSWPSHWRIGYDAAVEDRQRKKS